MTSPDIHALTGAYALDAVSGVERTDFERHLAECDSCFQEVQELQETAARLALAAAEPPPAELKTRVLNEIRSVRQLPPDTTVVPLRRRSLGQRLTTVAAAVFFVVAAGLGVVVVQKDNQLDDVQAQAAQMQEILGARDASLVTLDGKDGGGTMKVAVSRSQDRMLLVGTGLASPPDGKTYQLWGIADDTPVSLGLLTPDDGQVVLALSGLNDAQKVAISVEPEKGSKTPTTNAIVMTGDLPA
ncbi:anti-sigma factor [Actinophytocola oryzae]|uniref:Regulator of SigK n=1 Tax=Actinophytocola oryzae TaxID=502181 RepID=A0A4R7UWD6_9PSEU|nr:anti-sigma factor [Actinophytocola oryzae]TDV39845.1 anti-sigma-K factor RskA [Actinophytocola oryzae]